VAINGHPTKSTGSYREYASYGLKPDFAYKYEIRAQVVRNGQTLESVRTVYLTVGAERMVVFEFSPAGEETIARVW
jgi:uncharacterized protein (TIGR03000 family)